MKKFSALLLFLMLQINLAYAAPVANNTIITQVINTNVNFNSSVFEEAVSELDGGTFTAIELSDLPSSDKGSLESTSDDITEAVVIQANDIANLKFIPANDLLGTVSFSFRVNNGVDFSNKATMTIEYTDIAENTPPAADDMTVTVERNSYKTITLSAADSDLDGLYYTITEEPENGTLDKTNETTGIVIYTPDADYTGADSFKFKVNDGKVDSNTATVTIDVVEELPNTVPETRDISVTTEEGEPKEIQLLATDDDDDALTYIITEDPSNGTLDEGGIASGLVVYTPNSGYIGTDSFKYKVSDGKADSNISDVTITIEEKIDIPSFVYEDLKTHWVNFSAGHLADRGHIIGEQVGSRYFFYPEVKITRWEFLNYIIGALDLETATPDMELLSRYSDTELHPEYIKKIAAIATEVGFLNGVEENDKLYIQPYSYLTRAEAITMIGNVISKDVASDDNLTFDDKSDIPEWALQQVINLTNYKIINGYDDNMLRPNNTLTKAQTIEMLYQTLKYNDKESAVFRMIRNRVL